MALFFAGRRPMIARTVVWWGMLAIATVASGQTTRPAASAADETSSTATRTERLEQLIQRAEEGLLRIRKEIRDYQCVLTKQERVDGKLLEPQNLEVKIRNETRNGDVVTVPFSVYARFTAPAKLKGREVIYVEGQRGGDLLARRGGRRSPNMTLQLAPDSPLAMEGNRYPVTQIGVIIMVERLIEVMQTKVLSDDCVIKIYTDAKLDGRRCTHYEVTMQTRNKSDFMQARLFVDDEYRIPVYYAAYDWPETEGGDPELLEQYAYRRMKLNVGLTDKDFDPANPDYNFSSVKPLPDDAGK